VLVGALAAGALSLFGCGGHAAPPVDRAAIQIGRQFPYFRVYWVGARFQGVPVTAIGGRSGYERSSGTNVAYGDCERTKGLLSTGPCVLPLEVNTKIFRAQDNRSLGNQRNVALRCVPATVFDGGRSIQIYTGRVVVSIYADSAARALGAAAALRPLNTVFQGDAGASGSLPAPVYTPPLLGAFEQWSCRVPADTEP
jgi:hypothetical protein